jgi:hypothetical protein
MKRTNNYWIVLLLVWSIFLGGCGKTASASGNSCPAEGNGPPESVVESFYAWAIGQASGGREEGDFHPPEESYYLRPEVSPELVHHVEKAIAAFRDTAGGASPILCAQDIPEGFKVGEASIQGDEASVVVTTSFGTEITVELIFQDGLWKLREIRCQE